MDAVADRMSQAKTFSLREREGQQLTSAFLPTLLGGGHVLELAEGKYAFELEKDLARLNATSGCADHFFSPMTPTLRSNLSQLEHGLAEIRVSHRQHGEQVQSCAGRLAELHDALPDTLCLDSWGDVVRHALREARATQRSLVLEHESQQRHSRRLGRMAEKIRCMEEWRAAGVPHHGLSTCPAGHKDVSPPRQGELDMAPWIGITDWVEKELASLHVPDRFAQAAQRSRSCMEEWEHECEILRKDASSFSLRLVAHRCHVEQLHRYLSLGRVSGFEHHPRALSILEVSR